MNKSISIIFLTSLFFLPAHAGTMHNKTCPVQKRKLTDVDYNLLRAVARNNLDDTTQALKATNVYVNAQEVETGNTPFATAAYHFVTAKKKGKKSDQVAAGKIIQKLLENGAKPVTIYHSPSKTITDMKDDVELIFFIQKYSARR